MLEGLRRISVTSGAPQRSFLTPDQWKCTTTALIAARNVETTHLRLGMVTRRGNGWMLEHGLANSVRRAY